MENKKLIPDKLYSTYWWVANLDPNHSGNYNPNVTVIHGYSKFTARRIRQVNGKFHIEYLKICEYCGM